MCYKTVQCIRHKHAIYLGSSIVLIFIGFCTGTLFGLCGCITLVFNKKQSNSNHLTNGSLSKQKYKMCQVDEGHNGRGSIGFMHGSVSRPSQHQTATMQSFADLSSPVNAPGGGVGVGGDIMYPDIYSGAVRAKRF